jgi:hypothetical protein
MLPRHRVPSLRLRCPSPKTNEKPVHLAQAVPSLLPVSASQPDNLEPKGHPRGGDWVFLPKPNQAAFLPAFSSIGATHLLQTVPPTFSNRCHPPFDSFACNRCHPPFDSFAGIGCKQRPAPRKRPRGRHPQATFASIFLNRCHPPFDSFAGIGCQQRPAAWMT